MACRPAQWVADALAELAGNARVRLLPRTTVFGYFAQNMLGLAERVSDHLVSPEADAPRERLWQVRARHVVIAREQSSGRWCFPTMIVPGSCWPEQR